MSDQPMGAGTGPMPPTGANDFSAWQPPATATFSPVPETTSGAAIQAKAQALAQAQAQARAQASDLRRRGWLFLLGGLAVVVVAVVSFSQAEAHGGIIWIGGFFLCFSLVTRGLRMLGAATTLDQRAGRR